METPLSECPPFRLLTKYRTFYLRGQESERSCMYIRDINFNQWFSYRTLELYRQCGILVLFFPCLTWILMINAMERNMTTKWECYKYIKHFTWFCVVTGGRVRYYQFYTIIAYWWCQYMILSCIHNIGCTKIRIQMNIWLIRLEYK